MNFVVLNGLVMLLAGVNGYVHWRVLQGRPITRGYALALSGMDLAFITAGLGLTSRFDSNFFVLYYPALLVLAIVFFSRWLSFAAVALTAAAYAALAVTLAPGVSHAAGDDEVLAIRIATMFAVVVAANLIGRVERDRRREAVEAERVRMEENIQLQQRAQEAEQEAHRERIRISQEIHDGAAQSAYILSLGLETCSQLAGEDPTLLRDRLEALHRQSKHSLWELRYPINLGPLFEGRSLRQILEDHLNNFRTITSITALLSVKGEETELPLVTKQRLFSIAHNALTNAYQHSRATQVNLGLEYRDETIKLTIADNGAGVDTALLESSSGHGIRNMRRVAEELGGRFGISSEPGQGTAIKVTLPLLEF